MQSIRIIEIPNCKMVSSGVGMFEEDKFGQFADWFSSQKHEIYPKDFLFWDKTGFHWLYMYEEGMDVPDEFNIIDFKGGLYAVATDIDQQTDTDKMRREVDEFLKANGFERDETRPELGNIITPLAAREIMGYEQMDYYTPIAAGTPRQAGTPPRA